MVEGGKSGPGPGAGPGEAPRLSASPLSGNMSELFLLAVLALLSGLFPCAEPSRVSDEEKGKEGKRDPGPMSEGGWGGVDAQSV